MRRAFFQSFADANIVFDGNSLTRGYGSTISYPARVMSRPEFAGAKSSNLAVDGSSWRFMHGLDGGSAADVDGAWTSGKTNILVCWETTNSIYLANRTVAEAIADCQAYIAARKAAHAWRVLLLTTIPRTGVLDLQLRQFNAEARQRYRSWGVDVLVDVRSGVLNFNGETDAAFTATQSLWYETSAWVHLSDAGYELIAQHVARGLRRLPPKAP